MPLLEGSSNSLGLHNMISKKEISSAVHASEYKISSIFQIVAGKNVNSTEKVWGLCGTRHHMIQF